MFACVCLCVSEVSIELGVSNLVPRFNRLNIAGAGSEPCSAYLDRKKEVGRGCADICNTGFLNRLTRSWCYSLRPVLSSAAPDILSRAHRHSSCLQDALLDRYISKTSMLIYGDAITYVFPMSDVSVAQVIAYMERKAHIFQIHTPYTYSHVHTHTHRTCTIFLHSSYTHGTSIRK